MSMLAEQRRFETEVKYLYGIRERPTTTAKIEEFARKRKMSVEAAEGVLFTPLDRLSRSWCKAHANHLKARLEELGLTHNSPVEQTGTVTGTMWRMLKAAVKPRVETLALVLEALEQSAEEYLELADTADELERNQFAQGLQDLRAYWGLSMRRMAQELGVSEGSYVGWEAGRVYPTGEIADRLEGLVGVTVAEARAGQRNEEETLEGLPNFGRLLREARHLKRWCAITTAEKVGMTTADYLAWETTIPEHFIYATVRRLIETLGIPHEAATEAMYGKFSLEGLSFGQRLERLRQEKLLSTAEVADRLGVHPFVYRKYESEAQFPAKEYASLAEILGATPDELLGPGWDFAPWLRENLQRGGVTCEDLALAIGEETATVEAWAQGILVPEISQSRVIAAFLGVRRIDVYLSITS